MSEKPPDGTAARLDWPILVQTAGEAELGVVRDQDMWEIDPELHARQYQPEDRLIDSAGVEYRLVFKGAPGRGRNALLATGRRYSSGEVASIVERHIVSVGAKPEWLTAHLREIVESQRTRAIILYLSKLAAAGVEDGAEDEE